MRALIQILSFLLYLYLPEQVSSVLFITFPVVGTSLAGGQTSSIKWQDDGQKPLLADYGLTTFGIYVGDANDQIQVQQIQSVNASAVNSLAFTVNPNLGPDSDQYFIKAESSTGQLSFSARFSLTNMSGSFTPTESSLVFGTSSHTQSTSTTSTPITAPSPTPTGNSTSNASSSTPGSSSHSSTTALTGKPTTASTPTSSGPHETSTPHNGPETITAQSEGRRLSAGAIYGIVASLSILIMVTTVTLWCGCRRRRRQRLALKGQALLGEGEEDAAGTSSPPSNAPNTLVAGPSRQPTEMTQTTDRRISQAPELVKMPSDLSLMDPPLQHSENSVDMMYDVIPPGSEKPIRVLSYRRPATAALPEVPPPLVEITSNPVRMNHVSLISPAENSDSRQLQRQPSQRGSFHRPLPSNIPEDVTEPASSPRLFDRSNSPFRFAQSQTRDELSPFRTPSEERIPSPLGSKEQERDSTIESLSGDRLSSPLGSKARESIMVLPAADEAREEVVEEGEDEGDETRDVDNIRDSRTPSEIRAREAYLERQIENLRHLFIRTVQGEGVGSGAIAQDLDEPPPTYHPRSS